MLHHPQTNADPQLTTPAEPLKQRVTRVSKIQYRVSTKLDIQLDLKLPSPSPNPSLKLLISREQKQKQQP